MSKKTCSKSQLRSAKGGRSNLVGSAKGNFYKPYATKRDAGISRRVPVSAKRFTSADAEIAEKKHS